MSKKIKRIQAQINANILKQRRLRLTEKQLHNKLNDLRHELNKADPGYKEALETVKQGRKHVKKLIGRIYWREEFKDEDRGESVFVERSRICSIDGKPYDDLGFPLEYYDLPLLEIL